MDQIIHELLRNYGLDWITMLFGVSSGYLMARKDKRGIVCNLIACSSSCLLTTLSHQYGFTVSSVITMGLMVQAYSSWSRDEKKVAVAKIEREDSPMGVSTSSQ